MKNVYVHCFRSFLESFRGALEDEEKVGSVSYQGKRVIWYGTPGKMVVLHKSQIHGTWGNIYYPEKLQSLVDLINDSEEKVELECSYGIGKTVSPTEVIEHQQALSEDRFEQDYVEYTSRDGERTVYSTGDPKIDEYLGNPDRFIEDELYNLGDDVKEQLRRLHGISVTEKTPGEVIRKGTDYERLTEEEMEDIDHFVEMEESFRIAIDNNKGDIGNFVVQLRDGHHRVYGAMEAGEEYVCVDLTSDTLKNYIGKIEFVGE